MVPSLLVPPQEFVLAVSTLSGRRRPNRPGAIRPNIPARQSAECTNSRPHPSSLGRMRVQFPKEPPSGLARPVRGDTADRLLQGTHRGATEDVVGGRGAASAAGSRAILWRTAGRIHIAPGVAFGIRGNARYSGDAGHCLRRLGIERLSAGRVGGVPREFLQEQLEMDGARHSNGVFEKEQYPKSARPLVLYHLSRRSCEQEGPTPSSNSAVLPCPLVGQLWRRITRNGPLEPRLWGLLPAPRRTPRPCQSGRGRRSEWRHRQQGCDVPVARASSLVRARSLEGASPYTSVVQARATAAERVPPQERSGAKRRRVSIL